MTYNKEITKMTVDKLKDRINYLKAYGDTTAHLIAQEISDNLEFAMEILQAKDGKPVYKFWKIALDDAIDFLQSNQD